MEVDRRPRLGPALRRFASDVPSDPARSAPLRSLRNYAEMLAHLLSFAPPWRTWHSSRVDERLSVVIAGYVDHRPHQATADVKPVTQANSREAPAQDQRLPVPESGNMYYSRPDARSTELQSLHRFIRTVGNAARVRRDRSPRRTWEWGTHSSAATQARRGFSRCRCSEH